MWLLNSLIKLISKSLEEDQVGNSLLIQVITSIVVLFVKHYKGDTLPFRSTPFAHTKSYFLTELKTRTLRQVSQSWLKEFRFSQARGSETGKEMHWLILRMNPIFSIDLTNGMNFRITSNRFILMTLMVSLFEGKIKTNVVL